MVLNSDSGTEKKHNPDADREENLSLESPFGCPCLLKDEQHLAQSQRIVGAGDLSKTSLESILR